VQEILYGDNSRLEKFKEIIRQNLYKSTELNMNEKSKLIKIIQKKGISEEDKKVIKSLLGRLSKRELITAIFNSNINPNFTFKEKNIIQFILKEAKNRGIMLKSFKRIITEEPPPSVNRIALKKALSILEELTDEGRLPIYSKKEGFICPYKRILGDYIQKDHPEFEFP
ncbi:hypothetical protein LCGC14_3152880, partial [marine sediment metagenome]